MSDAGRGIFIAFIVLLVLVGFGFIVAGTIQDGGPQDQVYLDESSSLNRTSQMINTGAQAAPAYLAVPVMISAGLSLIVVMSLLGRRG